MPMIVWLIAAAWTVLILYLIVDVRRVMAFNNRANKRMFGLGEVPISPRSVLVNRVALAVILVLGNWAIFRAAGSVLGP
jgi:hypothetical protein